jgi:SAM-dependent methyltransferase
MMADPQTLYDERYASGTYREEVTGFEVARWHALAHVVRTMVPVGAKQVLDYGSGSGLHVPLWEAAFPGARLFFADISPVALEKLAKRYPAYAAQCQEIAHDRVAFPANSFAVVVSVEVMEHVEDLDAYLREVYRLLTPGGCFVWTTPCGNSGSIEHLAASLTGRITTTGCWTWDDPSHVRRLRSSEAEAALHAVGFRRVAFRFRSHLFSFVCTHVCRGPLRHVGEKMMGLDYTLFRRLPNGASMIGVATK